MTFDEIRERHPGLGFCVYAIEPGGDLTLEVHAPEGLFEFRGATLAAALELALPVDPPLAASPAPTAFD